MKNILSIFILAFGLNCFAQYETDIAQNQSWNGTAWKNVSATYSYLNSSQFLDSTYYFGFDTVSSQFNIPLSRSHYVNAGFGSPLTITSEDYLNANWENSTNYIYTYSGTNKLSTYVFQNWPGYLAMWRNVLKANYTYDINDFLVGIDYESWDTIANSWNASTKNVFINNPDGTPDSSKVFVWDNTNSVYKKNNFTTFTYTPSKKVNSQTVHIWIGSTTMNLFNTINTYDVNDNLLKSVSQKWDKVNSFFVDDRQNTSTYTNNKADTTLYEIYSSSTWNKSSRTIFSSILGSGINEKKQPAFSTVFPTITESEVYINLASNSNACYSLFDMKGRLVQQGTVNNNLTLNLNSENRGLYLLNIHFPKKNECHRIFKL